MLPIRNRPRVLELAWSSRGSRPLRLLSVLGAVALALVVAAPPAVAQKGDASAGKSVYETKCLLCHGPKGDGEGPAAERLDPRPRDFTSGLYKIRTTESRIPSDQDLFNVITRGMPGTSMPAWDVLPEKDRWNLVAYLKTFAPDAFKEAPEPLQLPKEVTSSAESIKRGKEMYEAIECFKCHGMEGRADGPSRPELTDEWGSPIAPANLTKPWNFRGGARPRDVTMRLAGGVVGTPMPAFADSVEFPEDVWHLANYVLSLGPARPAYATLVTASHVADALPDDPNAEFWRTLPPQNIPLMGQVIVDPRNFNPSIDMVSVRAAHSDKEIAFHLTWDDPTESTPDPKTKAFADAVSLQFPPTIQPGPERPYFLMGDGSEAVYLLRWDRAKGVMESTANGPTKVRPVEGAEATGKVTFEHGRYRLVIKRALAPEGAGRTPFRPGVFTPIAFQAWDGGAGETGTKMSLTSWYYLRLEEPQSNRRFVLPPVVALLTLAAMALIVRVAQGRASTS